MRWSTSDVTACACLLRRSERLGLDDVQIRRKRTANGLRDVRVFFGVRLDVQDRDCAIEVHETTDGDPVFIGHIPLTSMDFVVDPEAKRSIGNPAYDGEWQIEMYCHDNSPFELSNY